MSCFKQQSKQAQDGFTLVELLVAMVIGLFIVGGVVSVMVDSKDNFLFEQEVAFLQENARFITDELGADIRMAGYTGCVDSKLANVIAGSNTSARWMASSRGLWGYEEADLPADTDITGVVADTDIVIINRGDQEDISFVLSHDPAARQIVLEGTSSVVTGDVLVLSDVDCSNSAIFQASDVSQPASGDVINHDAGAVAPGNCSTALAYDTTDLFYDCQAAGTVTPSSHTYSRGSTLMRLESDAYYVKVSNITGLPSLYRKTLVAGSGVAAQEQELISGVEAFEVIYGVDTDATADGIVDVYMDANFIWPNDFATAASGWVGWDRVVSARVTVILRSIREAMPQAQVVDFGDGLTYDDRYLRQKVVQTSRVRNRGL